MSDDSATDPIDLFQQWLQEADGQEPNDPNAVALATADAEGRPSVRMVLLKGIDSHGFVFFTNFESQKGRELLENSHAGLCFYWKSLKRQVRVQGPVQVVDAAEADAYFASRPRASRIGAWASQQSRPMDGRWVLERRVAEETVRFHVGDVPRPDYWGGFRIVPDKIEFWRDRPFRLHERLVFQRVLTAAGAGEWTTVRLFP